MTHGRNAGKQINLRPSNRLRSDLQTSVYLFPDIFIIRSDRGQSFEGALVEQKQQQEYHF